jgi:phasin family protein
MVSTTGTQLFDQGLFDVRRYLELFSVPGATGQALLDAQRKNLETLAQANRIVFEAAQVVVQRQQEFVIKAMDEATEAVQQMQSAGSNEERVEKQTEIAKTAFETAQRNVRELAEMSTKSNSEAIELINKRVAESFDEMRSHLENVTEQTDQATATQSASKKAA